MYPGPGGADGSSNGSVRSHAWNAARYSGLNRCCNCASSRRSPAACAWSQAVNIVASATSTCPPRVDEASAANRVVEAWP
jgi:hypothetical protein